jgi:trk system potassium uptake protein
MKNVAVIGLGRYGAKIAKKLTAMGNLVLGIDINPEKVYKISAIIKSTAVGDAKNKSFLAQVINEDVVEVIICVGANMIDSILIVHNLKDMNIKHIVVKANDETHAEILKSLGVTEVLIPQNIIADWLTLRITEEPGNS